MGTPVFLCAGFLNFEIQKGRITKHRYHRPVIQAAPMRITRNSGKASASNGRILFNLSFIEKPHIDKLLKMSYAMDKLFRKERQ